MSESRRAYRVAGRVQGVGFRWWTRKLATRLGVEGSVRNRADGSVEVQARGTESALESLKAALRQGPPMARVTEVSEIDARSTGDRAGFHVDRGGDL